MILIGISKIMLSINKKQPINKIPIIAYNNNVRSPPTNNNSKTSWRDIAMKNNGNEYNTKGKSKLEDEDEATIEPIYNITKAVKPLHMPLRFIGGMDLSFSKRNNIDAVASLVIISFPKLEVVYELSEAIQLTEPYIAGYLAFREVPHLVKLIDKLKNK